MKRHLCHSDPAVAGEESLILLSGFARSSQRCFALLNMTDAVMEMLATDRNAK
jgi:hypothetical protein